MNIQHRSLTSRLELTRVVRLHTRLCFPLFKGEFTLLVGIRKKSQDPVFFLETLNLVFAESDGMGGGPGTPSACLPGGSIPPVEFDPKSNTISCEFDLNVDFPATRRGYGRPDPTTDTPGPIAVPTKARIRGRFLGDLRPREFGYQNLEWEIDIDVPEKFAKEFKIEPRLELRELLPLMWFYITLRKELCIQPVFISADGATPPTGEDFYPLLRRANEIWAKCCIQFTAKCPRYVDNQDYRVSTAAEATAFKDEVDVDDAIEVFVVERLDPEDTWGGGATFASGTATAKVVTGDNQLPLNQNHLAHELGHVLGLGHPGNPGGLVDSCAGSVMEPSGFFADNPEFQCRFNCRSAANPLLTAVLFGWCLDIDRPNDQLF